MGMDANINGRDVRLSNLLAEVAFDLFPVCKLMANDKGYCEFDKYEVSCIIVSLSEKLDDMKINESLMHGEIPMDRVRRQIMNLGKLYSLMDWCQDPKNDDTTLCFA
jgi:hypothetical protein